MDRGTRRVATGAFELTPTEIALLERAVPGEALVLCAGERVFLDVLASPAEQELFDTRPAEQAERNRQRRRSLSQPTIDPVAVADQTAAVAAPRPSAGPRSSAERSWHLFDDL